MGAPGNGRFEGSGGVYPMDAESHNAIGYYRTEEDALRDVVDIVAEHGRQSAGAARRGNPGGPAPFRWSLTRVPLDVQNRLAPLGFCSWWHGVARWPHRRVMCVAVHRQLLASQAPGRTGSVPTAS